MQTLNSSVLIPSARAIVSAKLSFLTLDEPVIAEVETDCFTPETQRVEIPAKLNAHFEGKPNGIPRWSRTPSERSDADISIVQEVFAFVK